MAGCGCKIWRELAYVDINITVWPCVNQLGFSKIDNPLDFTFHDDSVTIALQCVLHSFIELKEWWEGAKETGFQLEITSNLK